jgi:hypothetical protein
MATTYRCLMWLRHSMLPPRFASEPILCYQKAATDDGVRPRKVVL